MYLLHNYKFTIVFYILDSNAYVIPAIQFQVAECYTERVTIIERMCKSSRRKEEDTRRFILCIYV